MKLTGAGKILRIYVGESDQYRGVPLYHAMVLRIRQAGLAGATVTRGIEGFGANSRIHTANILRLSEDLPVVIEVIDTAEKIDAFLPHLDEMVKEGIVITVENVHVVKYAANRTADGVRKG